MAVEFNTQDILKYNTSQSASSSSTSTGSSADESIFTSSSGSSDITMASVFNYDPNSGKSEKANQEVAAKKKEKEQLEKEIKKIEGQIKKEENESKVSDLKMTFYSLQTKLTSAINKLATAISKTSSDSYEFNPNFYMGAPAASGYNSDSTQPTERQEGPILPAAGNYKQYGYDEQKGANLANSALNVAGTKGWCYRGVIQSLSRTGVSGLSGGSAYMAADQLAQRSDFVEVPKGAVSKDELKNLPAGAVVVWGKGDTENTKHGHISISLGDGRESSDHITNQYQSCGNGTYRIFLPK